MVERRATGAPPRPRRGASQNFLRSPVLAAEIVRDAEPGRGDLVLDVGAGSGRLTTALARQGCRVLAIEVDPAWARRLRDRFAAHPRVTVVEADILELALPREPFRVVANLPFDGGTAILRRLLSGALLSRADVILEWDVACKRAACWPSTLLGVLWGVRYELAALRRLPASCFEPAPRVDAGLLRILRRETPLVPASAQPDFERLVRAAFHGRPLTALGNRRIVKRVGRQLGFAPRAAPRDLDVHQWASLFAALTGEPPPGHDIRPAR